MIQYKYFHTDTSGFVSRMNVTRDDSHHRYYSDIFEKVRKGVEINSGGFEDKTTFTYATVGNDSLFVQASKGASSSLFVEGWLLDSIPVHPSRYIDKLERDKNPVDEDSPVLSTTRPPHAGNLPDSFSLASNLHHIFPKLIDALLYGEKDKQIIIVAENRESAVNYVKILNLLLPLAYMKKVGFSIGTSSIPYEPWTVVDDNGSLVNISVKLWLPNMASFNFDSYASFYYVFDTTTGRDNYTRPLSPVAKLIAEVNLANFAAASDLARTLASAFSENGSVDLHLLEKVSTLYLFDTKRDLDTAKSILRMGAGNDALQERAVITAIRLLLAPENLAALTPAETGSILREYRSNPSIAQEVESDLFHYLSASYQSLAAEERALFENMLAADSSGERLGQVLDEVPYADFEASMNAFTLTCRVLAVSLAQGYNTMNLQGILRKVVEFFDINNCRRSIPNEQLISGERSFDVAWGLPDMTQKTYALALLMASAYFTDADEDCCNIRIRGFKRILNAAQLTKLQKLEVIINVREKILEFSDVISGIDYRCDFLFNTELGRSWGQEILAALSMQELLAAYQLTYSRTRSRALYEGMISTLNLRLLDVANVRRNVIPGTPVYKSYVEFFYALPQELQAANAEIHAYLSELSHGSEIGNSLAQNRRDFLMNCFDSLSPKDKARVSREEVNVLNVSQYSERISSIFMESYKTGSKKLKHLVQKILTGVNGVAWCLIAFVLMELVSRGLDFGLQDHLSLVYDLHALPTIMTLCSGSLYVVNLSTNSFTKRNIFTAIETLILIIALFGIFRLLLL